MIYMHIYMIFFFPFVVFSFNCSLLVLHRAKSPADDSGKGKTYLFLECGEVRNSTKYF